MPDDPVVIAIRDRVSLLLGALLSGVSGWQHEYQALPRGGAYPDFSRKTPYTCSLRDGLGAVVASAAAQGTTWLWKWVAVMGIVAWQRVIGCAKAANKPL